MATYEQNTRIRLTYTVKVNPDDWNKWQTYALNDFVAYASKVWKATGATTGDAPVTGSVKWTEDSGRIDATTAGFALKRPSASAVIHTLVSASTIITRIDTGTYKVLIDTAPEGGSWSGEFFTGGTAEVAQSWGASVRPVRVAIT